MSASGRLSLAEHCGTIVGLFVERDPGDLSSMLVTDFMMAETGISHHLPQLMGAIVMPVLAFASLVWIDWRMAVSMFAALPLALLVLWASTKAQRKLSGRQIQAKINAGNRLEEYLQGIRVMKAYNLIGDRFVRLRDAFAELRRACICQEALLGPFVLLSITLVRAGLTMMVLCGTYLLLGGKLSILIFVLFLVVGSRVFDPLTSALTNFTEFRYFSIAGGRILSLMNEPEMKGERQSPAAGDIRFEHVSFAYQDKEVLHDINITLPEKLLDGSCRSFGKREKYGDEALRPFLRPTERTHSFQWSSDERDKSRKPNEPHLYGVPRCLSVSGHHTQQYPLW